MLVDFVEGHKQELIRQVESREAADAKPGPADGRQARIEALLEELIEALRRGDGLQTPQTASFSPDAALEYRERDLVRRDVIEEITRQSLTVTLPEMVIVSDWACAAERGRLREGYRSLSELLDDVYEAAVIFTRDGRVDYINRRAANEVRDTTRVPLDQIVGKTGAELGVPAEFEAAREPDELVAMARSKATQEVFFRGRWNEVQFRPIYAPSGDVSGVEFVSRDIHDPKLTQIRLKLLSKLSEMVGFVKYADVAEALAGVPIPELADWCVVNLVEDARIVRTSVANRDPAMAPLRERAMRIVTDWARNPLWMEMRLTTGFQLLSDVSDELLAKLAASEEAHSVLMAAGVRSIFVQPVVSRGEITAIFTLFYTTQSGRRYGRDDPLLAEELALHAAHIIEDARLLKDLRASEAQLRETVAFRNRMMGVLGHDLQTPISAVTMAAGTMVQRGRLGDEERDKARVIQRAVGRMTEMIATLLDFTRVECLGKLPVSAAPIDLGVGVREVVDEARAAWQDRAIDLEVRGDLRGRWDSARVKQATCNLIVNALQYGDPRKPVRISVDSADAAVVLIVKNEGPAVPPDLLPALFEPFSRGHSDRSPLGLGLGLYIVRQVAIAHGGTVDVASKAETGTVFTLRLPRGE
jgi:signal transduction histidine kinase